MEWYASYSPVPIKNFTVYKNKHRFLSIHLHVSYDLYLQNLQVCLSVCECLPVHNRPPNYAHYSGETFAAYSMGLE